MTSRKKYLNVLRWSSRAETKCILIKESYLTLDMHRTIRRDNRAVDSYGSRLGGNEGR